MTRSAIVSDTAPAAVGPYAHAAIGPGTPLFLSGQMALDPASGLLIDGDIGAQTHRIFKNIGLVLEAAGLTMSDVVKVNVYLTSMSLFDEMNEIYATFFEAPYPARTTVAVRALPLGAEIEVEVVAAG